MALVAGILTRYAQQQVAAAASAAAGGGAAAVAPPSAADARRADGALLAVGCLAPLLKQKVRGGRGGAGGRAVLAGRGGAKA